MADITAQLADARVALDEFLVSADGAADTWTTPRAPGKWSPSQLAEHVARSYESGANAARGLPSGFPTLPFFLRPLARRFLFDRVVRTGRFPKARTNAAMDPKRGPESPQEARQRLYAALAAFSGACSEAAASGDTMTSGTFGTIPVADYVRFMTAHTRHHRLQLPAS